MKNLVLLFLHFQGLITLFQHGFESGTIENQITRMFELNEPVISEIRDMVNRTIPSEEIKQCFEALEKFAEKSNPSTDEYLDEGIDNYEYDNNPAQTPNKSLYYASLLENCKAIFNFFQCCPKVRQIENFDRFLDSFQALIMALEAEKNQPNNQNII